MSRASSFRSSEELVILDLSINIIHRNTIPPSVIVDPNPALRSG